MIIKKCYVDRRGSLRNLIHYLSSGEGGNRVLEMGYQNIELTHPKLVALEMEALKREVKKKKKNENHYNHYMISFTEKEENKIKDIGGLVKSFCEKMKLDKCQCFWVKHGDTENTHVHIVINRIDVEEKKLVDIESIGKFDINELSRCRMELEIEYNLERTRNSYEERMNKINSVKSVGGDEAENKNENKRVRREFASDKIKAIKWTLLKGRNWNEIEKRLEGKGWIYCMNEDGEIALVNHKKDIVVREKELNERYQLSSILQRIEKTQETMRRINENRKQRKEKIKERRSKDEEIK